MPYQLKPDGKDLVGDEFIDSAKLKLPKKHVKIQLFLSYLS
jgi:hypothetical protein